LTFWTLGLGTSSSLIAAGVGYWLIERSVAHALVISGVGIVVLILTLVFAKKPGDSAPVDQKGKQEANPHISSQINPQFSPQFHNTVVIGAPGPRAGAIERESAHVDAIVLDHMKADHPTQPYLIDEMSNKLGITMPDARDSMERLVARNAAVRIRLAEAKGGRAYLLDELHRPHPAPERKKPNTITTYSISSDRPKIVPIRFGRTPDNRFGLFVRNDGTAAFDIAVEEPVLVGTAKLHFWDRIYPGLTTQDGELFIEACIELSPGSGLGASALRDLMVKADLESVTLKITYRDFDNNGWLSQCEILREVWAQGLRVASLKQEGPIQPS
jgi:hypothetical protein